MWYTRNFDPSKGTLRERKDEPRTRKELFTTHETCKSLPTRTQKDLLQIMKEKTNNTIKKWTKDVNKLQTSYKRASKSGQNMWRLLVKEMQTNVQRDASSCPLYCAKCWQGSEGNRNSQCQLWQNWRSFWKAIWNHLVKVNLHTPCRLPSPS